MYSIYNILYIFISYIIISLYLDINLYYILIYTDILIHITSNIY